MIGLISRDPKAETRTRRHEQEVADLLNGLIRSGFITGGGGGGGPPGPPNFGVVGTWAVGYGPPVAGTRGVVGDFYFDLMTGKLYELF